MKVISSDVYDCVGGAALSVGGLSSMLSSGIDGVIMGAVFGGKYATAGGSWTGGLSNIVGIAVGPFLGGIFGATIGFFLPEVDARNVMARVREVVLGGENSNSGGQFN